MSSAVKILAPHVIHVFHVLMFTAHVHMQLSRRINFIFTALDINGAQLVRTVRLRYCQKKNKKNKEQHHAGCKQSKIYINNNMKTLKQKC